MSGLGWEAVQGSCIAACDQFSCQFSSFTGHKVHILALGHRIEDTLVRFFIISEARLQRASTPRTRPS